MVVEDFGTTGLEGDTRQGGLGDNDNRFFSFFRAEGLSGNPADGTSGGSWGVGKSVFNRCSRLNSFLALTVPRDSMKTLLLGKSLIWHHRLREAQYHGIGQFGLKSRDEDFLVMPVDDERTIHQFKKDFNLRRSVERGNRSPGLSVVIPLADQEVTREAIIDIVLREYFHPILAGRLSVCVLDGHALESSAIKITANSIHELASRFPSPEVSRVLEISRWSMQTNREQPYLVDLHPDAAPRWADALLGRGRPAFATLCESFERGVPIAIRVPVRIHPARKSSQIDHFDVYLQRDLDGPGHRPIFVRGWTVVPNARQKRVRNQSIYSLVIIDKGHLATMLRAAEPPAHTFWSAETANFRGRYQHGKHVIEFVTSAPKFLAGALASTTLVRDLDAWADYFPSPETGGSRSAEGNSRKGKKRVPSPIQPPPPRPKPFRIGKSESGFSVVRDNADSTPLPALLEITVAYDSSRGNPFQKYHKADFRIERLHRTVKHASEVDVSDNTIVLKPVSNAFRLDIEGFDVRRDVVVRVNAIDATPGDAP